jgi:N-methylhydantoinase B
MKGGAQGSKNYTKMIFADGRKPEIFGKTAQYHMKKGDVARLITASGGGYDNPMERPVEKVVEDVKNGYITPEIAKKGYGVVIDAETFEVKKLLPGRQSG